MFTARAGPIPEELGALSELRELSLGSNQLTGTGRASRFGRRRLRTFLKSDGLVLL